MADRVAIAGRFARALVADPDAAMLAIGNALAAEYWRGLRRGVLLGLIPTVVLLAATVGR